MLELRLYLSKTVEKNVKKYRTNLKIICGISIYLCYPSTLTFRRIKFHILNSPVPDITQTATPLPYIPEASCIIFDKVDLEHLIIENSGHSENAN
jgi:hypothetical protein